MAVAAKGRHPEEEKRMKNDEESDFVISLVDAHMGVAILPLSAVKHSVASVVARNILDWILMSEIGMAVRKGTRSPVVDNFRSFALKNLGHLSQRRFS
jgi:DNA-binding transcriptional LysR family regulator